MMALNRMEIREVQVHADELGRGSEGYEEEEEEQQQQQRR